MLIRPALPSDLPALLALLRRVVPLMLATGNLQWDDEYPNAEVFARDIEQGELWVAEPAHGVLAGVAAITTAQSPEYAQAGWDIHEPAIVVHRLAVDPKYRGAGIATALMQQAEAIAREHGVTILRVDTSMQNAAIQRIFTRLGYTLGGEISLDFRPGLRILCYEKRLSPTSPGAASSQQSTLGLRTSHHLHQPAGHLAAIALGSNLASAWGDREANLREAVSRLGALGAVRAVSSFYDTAPVGYTGQPRFLNAALLLETALEPLHLMRALLDIERAMGRDRSSAPAKGPRVIDLDLLLLDDLVLSDAHSHDRQTALTLPHPAMAERRFVLEPLAEIAPQMVDPVSARTVAELLALLAAEPQ